jgi:hypothetical protein
MTAKEKVLAVYPNAYCEWDYNVSGTKLIRFWIKNGNEALTTKYMTSKAAWQAALNQLIKQGLCTE